MAKITLRDKTAWFVGGTYDHVSRNAAQDLKEFGGFGHALPFRHMNIALNAMNDQLSIRPDIIVMVDEQPDAGRQYTDKIIAEAKEKKIPVLLFTERELSEQLELAKKGVNVFPFEQINFNPRIWTKAAVDMVEQQTRTGQSLK